MKKIIFLLAFAFVALAADAQDKNKTFGLEDSFVDFTFGASDSVSNFDTPYIIAVNPSKMEPLEYDVMISLEHVSGTPALTVTLETKTFSEDPTWTIEETFFHGTAVDTIIRWSELTTPVQRRLWRINMVEAGTAKTLVEDNKWKFWR